MKTEIEELLDMYEYDHDFSGVILVREEIAESGVQITLQTLPMTVFQCLRCGIYNIEMQ